jgi:hypothetical protein
MGLGNRVAMMMWAPSPLGFEYPNPFHDTREKLLRDRGSFSSSLSGLAPRRYEVKPVLLAGLSRLSG